MPGLLLSVTFAHAEIVDPSLAPDQLVEAVSNNVIDEIRKDPELAKAEPSHVRELVDKHILPYTDFARMTKMAVGLLGEKQPNNSVLRFRIFSGNFLWVSIPAL